ncbi:exodeoxyribonuclease III [Propionibacteriaceae bacterium Y2011]|uniref:exodeoxyribonuclease III n=1 Tax=Microlunatus sp. Y2014 TaxID=3418488 RepID=UPI003B4CA7F2
MRLATFNVNGIRAAIRRGLATWLTTSRPDILALQEVRCPVDALPEDAFGGYRAAYHPGDLPGRNGVAVLTRTEPEAIRLGTGSREFDHEGRYVEVDLPGLTVGSLYLPKGGTPYGDEALVAKYERKLRFCRHFARYLTTARRRAAREGREFCVMGDWNIAPTAQDVANARTKHRSEGFLPAEREWIDAVIGPRRLVDVVRHLRPDEQGPYSWWSWRGRSWDSDAGWRIDLQLATPRLAAAARCGGTDRSPSYDRRISDHAPVVVDYEWEST